MSNTMDTQSPTVYIPVVIEKREEHGATVCGAFLNKKNAVHALIRVLVENGYLAPYHNFGDEEVNYRGEELREGDNGYIAPYNSFKDEEVNYRGDVLKKGEYEFNIQVLCKHANTFEDVKDICDKLADSYYEDDWKIALNEIQLQ